MKNVKPITNFIFCFLLSYGVAFAQPTITHNSLPQTGGTNAITLHSVNAATLSQGPSGADIAWNFETLDDLRTTTHQARYIVKEETPYAGTFTDANIAIEYTPVLEQGILKLEYEFFNKNSDVFIKNGQVTSGLSGNDGVGLVYNNPQDWLEFPLNYQDTYMDDFESTYSVSGNLITQTGTMEVTADAHGSIVLPYGTIDDVLRIKTELLYTEVVEGSDLSFDYEITKYSWLHPEFAFPLFEIYIEKVVDSPQAASVNAFYSVNEEIATITSVEDNELREAFTFAAYPNPAENFATIGYQLPQTEVVQTNIYNVTGQKVMTLVDARQTAGRYQLQADFSNHPKGMYIIELVIGKKILRDKIMVQ